MERRARCVGVGVMTLLFALPGALAAREAGLAAAGGVAAAVAATDFTWSPASPAIGQVVTFTPTFTTLPPSARWTFDAAGCSEPAVVTSACGLLGCAVQFHFASSGPHAVSLAVNSAADPGTFTTVATKTVTVAASGTCGSPPTVPVLLSPGNGASVAAGVVAFSWAASSGTTPIMYAVRAGILQLCSTASTSCSATLPVGTYTWSVSASNALGTATSASRTLVVTCVAPGVPTTPVPADGASVQPGAVTLRWAAPASGPGPFTYDVYMGSGDGSKVCSSVSATECTVQNVTAPPAERLWWVVARSTCGSTAASPHWTFRVCEATAVPVADFTWFPASPVTVGGVTQEQPFEGQVVTFEDRSSNFPTAWDWTDFSSPPPWAHFSVPQPTYSWPTPGKKVVRLTATNCIGASQQVAKTVTVYPDTRPVTSAFSVSSASPLVGQEVTFTAATGDEVGSPNRFRWEFGDGTGASESESPTVTHVFACGRTFTVTLWAARVRSRTVAGLPGTASLTATGPACVASELMVLEVARNLPGVGGAMWGTEVQVLNPTTAEMGLRVRLKVSGHDAVQSPPFTLEPGELLTLEELLDELAPRWSGYTDFTKAALWLFRAEAAERGVLALPGVAARTHTGVAPAYDDFGTFVPVQQVAVAPPVARTLLLMGLQHNGRTAQQQLRGFRTNLTIADPSGRGLNGGDVRLVLLRPADPSFRRERSLGAYPPYGMEQRALPRFFDGVGDDVDLGVVVLRAEVKAGVDVALGCSLVNNATNAPVFVPPQELPAAE